MDWPLIRLLIAIFLTLSLSACKKEKKTETGKIGEIVAQDKKLAEEELDILTRRGSLQTERAQIRDKKTELLNRMLTVPETDTATRTALEEEQTQLASQESKIEQQEQEVSRKLDLLLNQKNKLVNEAITEDAKSLLISRREGALVYREQNVARRETEIARREKGLAEREYEFTKRQAKMCGSTTTIVQTIAPPRGSDSRKYERDDVEPVYKADLQAMQSKGILAIDLPPGIDRLSSEIRQSMSKGDYTRAKYAAEQLLSAVKSLQIDRGFIGAKISRLSQEIRRRPPKGGKKAEVNELFQQATAQYGDGHLREANLKLNRIYTLLD